MSEKYTLREVHVEVLPGVSVVAEVASVEGIEQLLSDLKGWNLVATARQKVQAGKEDQEQKRDSLQVDDSPVGRIERNAGLPKGSLVSKDVLAFKEGVPQLLRPSAFGGPTDGAVVLIHALETGLKSASIDYDSFKALYDAQNLKSGTPLSMLMTNLRNSGYLDKTAYKDDRKVRLTAKGDKQAIEILRKLIGKEKN